MNNFTSVKKIYDIQAKKDRELTDLNRDLEKARAELKEASDTLELTEDEAEYKKASEAVRDAKERITFINRLISKKEVSLSPEERRELEKGLRSDHEAITKDYAKKIDASLNDLLGSCEEYQKHVKDFKDVAEVLAVLSGSHPSQGIKVQFNDLGTVSSSTAFSSFVNWYSNLQNQKEMFSKNGLPFN